MKHEYFDCQCTAAEHTIRIDVFEPMENDPFQREKEIYIQFQLNRNNGFWKRIWVALRYAFGYTCKYGHWDEFLVRPEDYQRLVNIFKKDVNEKSIS